MLKKAASFIPFSNSLRFHEEYFRRNRKSDCDIGAFRLENLKHAKFSLNDGTRNSDKMVSDEPKILPPEPQNAVGKDHAVGLCETTRRISICSVHPESPNTPEQNLMAECDETVDTTESLEACSLSTPPASELLVDWDKPVDCVSFESCSHNTPALELLVEFGETVDSDSCKYSPPPNPAEELLVEFSERVDINSLNSACETSPLLVDFGETVDIDLLKNVSYNSPME